uniref:Uncharacterized protein n=1 Tax=Oryzias sinensis TaxID=183150 RepID=A0A8C7XZ86_9TELE
GSERSPLSAILQSLCTTSANTSSFKTQREHIRWSSSPHFYSLASPLLRAPPKATPPSSLRCLHDNRSHKSPKEVRGMRKCCYVVLRTSTFDSFSIV